MVSHKLLNMARVAELAGVSKVAILKAVHSGRLPATEVMGRGDERAAWVITATDARNFIRRGRVEQVIKDMVANGRAESLDRPREPSAKTGLLNIMAKKRVGSVVLYSMAALFLAAFCSFVFNALDQDTEFAIAIMGSLIGGFLGAMLAAALIVDIYLPKRNRDLE